MKTYQRRVMDMFERVDQFGKKPELTLTAIITTLLAVVTAKLGAMRAWVAGQTNGQGHYREGAAERRGLKTAIYATLRAGWTSAARVETTLARKPHRRLPSRRPAEANAEGKPHSAA